MIHSTPKVSVIIPCYNDKDYIGETLESVLNQTFKDFEVIIVDDGSDQKTKKVLDNIKHPQIKVLKQEKNGPSKARNLGVLNAKGKYVLTIDSDDTFHSSFLLKAVEILDSNNRITAVSSYCNIFIGNFNIIHKHSPKGGGINDFLFDNNSTSFALIRKSNWLDIGGYDENMIHGTEDWEFWISLTKNGGLVYVIEEYLFNYRDKKGSLDKQAKEFYRVENLSYIYKKHKDVYINNFNDVVDYLSGLAKRNKKNEIKYKTSIDFRIGKFILFPIRYVKRIFTQIRKFK